MNAVVLLISVSVFCLVLGILSFLTRSVVEERLARVARQQRLKDLVSEAARTLGSLIERASIIKELLRPELLEVKLRTAGFRISVTEFMGIWASAIIGAFVIASLARGIFPMFFLPFIVLLGFAVPKAYVERRYHRKRILLRRQFIEFVERVQVGLSGGIGFYQVLKWAAKSNSLLSVEIKRIIEDVDLGTKLEDALDSFARRMDDIEVDNFVTTIKHALRNGLNPSEALNNLILDMRRRKDAKIDEVTKKAETKLIFPIVITVFPATILLVLGPMAIYVVRIFM
ncbi:MAG: type II secretion system F family protein [Bacillota bacterium]